jgi:hypothetical protein
MKTTRNLSEASRSPGRVLNQGPPEYEAGVFTTRLRRSVTCMKKVLFYVCSFLHICASSYTCRLHPLCIKYVCAIVIIQFYPCTIYEFELLRSVCK